jgi:2-polyprenyl-3-methyl-5-hydroxy-6-metoxy-1,4-benzoquinol methylase
VLRDGRFNERSTVMQLFEPRDGCPACRCIRSRELYRAELGRPPIRTYLEAFYSPQGGIDFALLGNQEYVVCECAGCYLIYRSNILSDKGMAILYERWLDPGKALERQGLERNKQARYSQEITAMARHLRKRPADMTVLDFGMGWGEWCVAAMSHGCTAFGTEISAARRQHAASKGIGIVHWNELPQQRFDIINVDQVLEHIPKPLETLKLLRQALSPSGVIKVSVPDGGDIKRRLRVLDWTAPKGTRNSLNPISPLEHINCFDRSALLRIVRNSGLHAVDIPVRLYLRTLSVGDMMFDPKGCLLKPLYYNALRCGTSVICSV